MTKMCRKINAGTRLGRTAHFGRICLLSNLDKDKLSPKSSILEAILEPFSERNAPNKRHLAPMKNRVFPGVLQCFLRLRGSQCDQKASKNRCWSHSW